MADTIKPGCVSRQGFSLHAGIRCRADQRRELERLCRYITRPALLYSLACAGATPGTGAHGRRTRLGLSAYSPSVDSRGRGAAQRRARSEEGYGVLLLRTPGDSGVRAGVDFGRAQPFRPDAVRVLWFQAEVTSRQQRRLKFLCSGHSSFPCAEAGSWLMRKREWQTSSRFPVIPGVGVDVPLIDVDPKSPCY